MKNRFVASSSPSQPVRKAAPGFTAFAGHRRLAAGPLAHVARKAKEASDRGETGPILVFDDRTGEFVEIDFRGTPGQVVERLTRAEKDAMRVPASQPRGPGRPKLGVIAREVTLLPGQWDWLDGQTGGASAALRRLVYEARRSDDGRREVREAQDAVYRFMTTMAGDFVGFEEALRAFYRREHRRFNELIWAWPEDVRRHIKRLVLAANPRGLAKRAGNAEAR